MLSEKKVFNIIIITLYVALLVIGARPQKAQGVSAWTISDIPNPGGQYGAAVDINDYGEVVGYTTQSYNQGYYTAYRWSETNQSMTLLENLGGTYSGAYAINNSGTIVGQSERVDGSIVATIWEKGATKATEIITPANNSTANDITDSGIVSGQYVQNGVPHGFIWNSDTSVFADLGPNISIEKMNEQGAAVGHSGVDAILWDIYSTTYTILDKCDPVEPQWGRGVASINDNNIFIGNCGNDQSGWVYENNNFTVLPRISASYGSEPRDINDNGVIVAYDGYTDGSVGRAVALIPGSSEWTSLPHFINTGIAPYAINNTNTIVGFVSNSAPGSPTSIRSAIWQPNLVTDTLSPRIDISGVYEGQLFTAYDEIDIDCSAEDNVAVDIQPILTISGGPSQFTATCSGATDTSGNVGTSVSVNYVVEVLVVPPTEQTFAFMTSADTYLRSGQSNRNHGADTEMLIQSSGNNRGLVKFDQSEIATAVGSGAITSAKLKLTITSNGNNWGTTGRSLDLHRLIKDWAEGNGTANNRGTGSGATWDCAIDSIIENQSKNCSGLTEWEMGQPNNPLVHPWIELPSATQTIINNQTGVIEFDVTADLIDFMNGADNFGWLIKKTSEGQNGQISFGTKESPYVPELIIIINGGDGGGSGGGDA